MAGLTVLDHDETATGDRLRVQSEHARLSARLIEGNASVGNVALDAEPTTIPADGTRWRGFDNVTTVDLRGDAWVLLAQNGTGVVLRVDAPRSGENPADETDRGSREQARPTDSLATDPRRGNGSTPSQDRPTAGSPNAGGSEIRGDTDGSRQETGADPPSARPALALTLALLAGGALAVERCTRRREGEEEGP